MGDRLRSIGAMSRRSGLSISALRFYDSAGVLRPTHVDPATGYRWYAADQVNQARLIAALRRVSMPLTDICDILASRHDPAAVSTALDQHMRRLEDGLADARRQLDAARDLLAQQEKPMTHLVVAGEDLASALDAVRFAASKHPDLPALNGVLFDYDGTSLRLVASDRYRLAVVTVPSRDQHGPAAQAIAPLSMLDDLELPVDRDVPVLLDSHIVSIGELRATPVDAAFPDYQRLLRVNGSRRVTITTANLRHRVATGPVRTAHRPEDNTECEVSVLLVDGDNVEVLDSDHPEARGFNREFLLQALDATGTDQLVLALDGPIEPLAILDPDCAEVRSLLMPSRLCQCRGMLTVEELRPVVRAAWGPDTCYPHAREEWRLDNPARDQCGMTALVVQDLLGGDLILGEVHVDGTKVGNHYWNRLQDGAEVDLTADQFLPEEVIVKGQVVDRPPDAPRRHRQQYELLRERVLHGLSAPTVQSDRSFAPATGDGK